MYKYETCTNMNNSNSLIIAGERLKAKIGYINKEIARLEGIQMKMVGNKKYKNTKKIQKLYKQRRNYCNTYIHKASRMIINYAKENGSGTIVIGDIKNIKQKMKRNKIIEVAKIGEEYTSGVSSIDKEEISKKNYNKARRIERGLFKTNSGKIINADVNGSINILRKYIKEVFSPNLEIAIYLPRTTTIKEKGCLNFRWKLKNNIFKKGTNLN